MLILSLLIILIIFIILKINVISNKYLKTFLKYVMYSLIIALVLEVSLFQYRHYESLFFKPSENVSYTFSDGIECLDGCTIKDPENAYIEITNLNKKVSNLYLDIASWDLLHFTIELKDEADALYYYVGEANYTNVINLSKYIRIHSSGQATSIKLNFNTTEKLTFNINKISINSKVPMNFNNYRFLLVSFFILFIFCINPKSILHDLKFNHSLTKYLIPVIMIIMALVFYKLTTYNLYVNSLTDMNLNQSQYKNLAEALASKSFALKLEVTPELKALKNPYDTYYRDSVLKAKDYHWDYAYYKGKYYSYFGVVPCLLIYLPYYAISGHHIANNIALSITCTLFALGVFYFLYQLIKKYFPKTSLIWYLILSIFTIFTSNTLLALGCANFYYIPIFMALAFSLLGLGFYLKATTYEEINIKYLFLGSTCMALIAGCRPQILVSLIFVPIILWDSVFKKRELFSLKTIKETVVTIAPYLIIASLLMFYNYKRFGNIFDFGAAYNLTTNDMTKRGFEFDRIFTGIYYYLLQPSYFTPVFPFLQAHHVATTYIGKTIYEAVYGGFFFTNLICLLSLFIFKFKKEINNKTLFYLSLSSLIGGFIIIIADTQMAGILPRYISDFALFFTIPTIIIILSLINKLDIRYVKLLLSFIVISLIFNALIYFQAEYLFYGNPYLLPKLTYLFSFWL